MVEIDFTKFSQMSRDSHVIVTYLVAIDGW